MTLDEAIANYEQIVFGTKLMKQTEAYKYNAQILEWLRELKAYKEFEERGYVMCRFAVSQDDRQRITKMVLNFSTKDIFDNVVEVNADE